MFVLNSELFSHNRKVRKKKKLHNPEHSTSIAFKMHLFCPLSLANFSTQYFFTEVIKKLDAILILKSLIEEDIIICKEL